MASAPPHCGPPPPSQAPALRPPHSGPAVGLWARPAVPCVWEQADNTPPAGSQFGAPSPKLSSGRSRGDRALGDSGHIPTEAEGTRQDTQKAPGVSSPSPAQGIPTWKAGKEQKRNRSQRPREHFPEALGPVPKLCAMGGSKQVAEATGLESPSPTAG